jgi:hypothetical protein
VKPPQQPKPVGDNTATRFSQTDVPDIEGHGIRIPSLLPQQSVSLAQGLLEFGLIGTDGGDELRTKVI